MQASSLQYSVPSRLRTAICCDLLQETLKENSTPLLERLKIELFRSIYGKFADVEASEIHSRGDSMPPIHFVETDKFFTTLPYFEQLKQLKQGKKKEEQEKQSTQKLNKTIQIICLIKHNFNIIFYVCVYSNVIVMFHLEKHHMLQKLVQLKNL